MPIHLEILHVSIICDTAEALSATPASPSDVGVQIGLRISASQRIELKKHKQTQTLHVCHICLHWGGFGGQCKHIWHTWSVWGRLDAVSFKVQPIRLEIVPQHPQFPLRAWLRICIEFVHAIKLVLRTSHHSFSTLRIRRCHGGPKDSWGTHQISITKEAPSA